MASQWRRNLLPLPSRRRWLEEGWMPSADHGRAFCQIIDRLQAAVRGSVTREGGESSNRSVGENDRKARRQLLSQRFTQSSVLRPMTNWQSKVMKKRWKAKKEEEFVEDIDYDLLGQDWTRKRIEWLCKEIPNLRAAGVVKVLNDQKNWIKPEHAKEIIDHTLRISKILHAHRIHRWMQQRRWYTFDFDLNTKLAQVLGKNTKVSRTRELFDEILSNRKVPHASTFSTLIEAYIRHGKSESIDEAWELYNQMTQLGSGIPSISLQLSLFKALTTKVKWLEQASKLFNDMKASGYHVNSDMYISLIELYGKHGDQDKIDTLVKEMNDKGYAVGLAGTNAILDACRKDGDKPKAENAFQSLIEAGIKPDWHVFISLIQMYGKAGMHLKSLDTFEQMKQNGIAPNGLDYAAIIKVMANAFEKEHVKTLLEEAENNGCKPLVQCYNAAMEMFLGLKMHNNIESLYDKMKAACIRPNQATYNVLISSSIGNGKLERAETLVVEMNSKGAVGANMHTYNLLLEGFAVAGVKQKVEEIFQEMMKKGFQVESHLRHHLQGIVSLEEQATLEKKRLELSDEQREIIVGLLLGGGHAQSPDGGRSFELHFAFSPSSRSANILKDHLYQLFLPWLKPECQELGSGSAMSTSSNKHFRFEMVSHGSFRFYALQYRLEGRPVIPRLIHRWLKPRTLAYWYMYGGFKCERTGNIMFDTSDYSHEEIWRLVKVLKTKTIECKIRKWRNRSVIWIEGESSLWLWKLMEPHILEEIKDNRP